MRKRKYGAKKTTTREGKAAYMQPYMIDYRKKDRAMINEYKKMFGIKDGRKKRK